MFRLVGLSVEGSESLFPQPPFLEDIVKLLEAINRQDFDAFLTLLERVGLNGIYDHEQFPEPQLLSRFLLLYFLGFIDGEVAMDFPTVAANMDEVYKFGSSEKVLYFPYVFVNWGWGF